MMGRRSRWEAYERVSEKYFRFILRRRQTYIYDIILNEDTQPVIRAIGVSHTACKDEFRQNVRSHSWSVF